MKEPVTMQPTKEPQLEFEERNLGAWLLLSYLTFGIVYLVWLFHIRKDIYKLQNKKQVSYVDFVLAILIFPYGVYYIYKLARELEALSKEADVLVIDDLALSSLLISLLPTGNFVALTIIQATLNKIVARKKETV